MTDKQIENLLTLLYKQYPHVSERTIKLNVRALMQRFERVNANNAKRGPRNAD